MSTPLPPIPPNIEEITAPLLLGTVWNWCLYGTLIVQYYVYTYNFPTDSRYLKLLVSSLFIIETLQTALSGADLYYWFASGFGDMTHLASPYASAFDVPIMGAIVSLAVQVYFAYRVWVLGNKKHWWFSAIICLVATVDSSAAFGGGIYAHLRKHFASGRWLRILAMTWLIGNTVADTLIASAMLYHLLKLRKREGRFSSHALVSVVRLTIETNILTTTVSIVAMFMVILYSDKNWYTCPTAIIGKLYSNTLLVSLNNRISIRESMASRGAIRSPAGTFPGSSARSEGTSDIVLMDLEKQKSHPLGERTVHDKVIHPVIVDIA
ncbi:hypothetical protein EDB85DRAFT_2084857 [Lactarius pseudohatsudake]|nr:hypothetical protein EDB85DRAFT_2084857 [Lactarius pseudohatsudake]